jgi:hypothetical protein
MISQEYLDAVRRARYFAAVAEVAHEFGRQGLTVTTLCQVGHSARNTFYENFRSIDHCLRQAIDYAHEQVVEPLDNFSAEEDRPARIEAAIDAFYRAVADAPLLASADPPLLLGWGRRWSSWRGTLARKR